MSRDPREAEVRGSVRALRPPDEGEALERAVSLAATEARGRVPAPPRRRVRAAVAAVVAAGAAAVLALTPAGADVRDWVANAIDDDPPIKKQALTRLPGGGRALVTSREGLWVVDDDGTRRLLGDYDDATSSPNGLYIAATRGRQLAAIEPDDGSVRWTISRDERISDARWAPSGFRVAFLSGERIWTMPADASSAPTVLDSAKPTAPSWRPPREGADPALAPNVVSYARSRSVVTRDVDTGEVLWRHSSPARPQWVVWAGPERLAVATFRDIRIFNRDGKPLRRVPIPPRTTIESVAAAAAGERLAVVLAQQGPAFTERSRLYLARIGAEERIERTVFSGFGEFGSPTFSPGGDWILLPWLDTDQWLFINPSEDRKLLRRVVAVGDISRQFDPGGRGRTEAPVVTGWCCAGG
jgi:hypothetical protein